jgi:hypothetical protein
VGTPFSIPGFVGCLTFDPGVRLPGSSFDGVCAPADPMVSSNAATTVPASIVFFMRTSSRRQEGTREHGAFVVPAPTSRGTARHAHEP